MTPKRYLLRDRAPNVIDMAAYSATRRRATLPRPMTGQERSDHFESLINRVSGILLRGCETALEQRHSGSSMANAFSDTMSDAAEEMLAGVRAANGECGVDDDED
jgi:hypothetical protein